MKKIIVLFLTIFLCNILCAQRITKEQYIDMYKDLAIREMKRMGIPAAITLAQGLLESEGGNSELLKKSNNHFGIKCKDTWSAAGVSHDDDAKGECFRVYKNAEESYRDHSNFLRSRAWYAPLFKLDPMDYKGWAHGLKRAGYATNPRYPEMLIKFIEDNNLQQYDNVDRSEIAHFDASKYTDDPEDKEIAEVVKLTGGKVENPFTLSTTSLKEEVNINNKKAIFVKSGTSLLAFATDHHLNLDKLLEYNDLDKDGLIDGDQYLYVERKEKENSINSYTVQGQESLWEVSQKNGVRLQKLLDYNNFQSDKLLSNGTILFLTPNKKNISAASNNSDVKVHKVLPKEGLNSISKKYGITIAQIKEWNNLQSETLQIGQELKISK